MRWRKARRNGNRAAMKVTPTRLSDVLLIEPDVYGDARGWFMESWQAERYQTQGIQADFTQANLSYSEYGVLRGLHYQYPEPQGKLVMVVSGTVFDVAVDIRRGSATFGQWAGLELSGENHRQLWIPEGFAHGFQVLSAHAVFAYFCTRKYCADYDAVVACNDPDIGVQWTLPPAGLSAKDAAAPRLSAIDADRLPEL